MKREVDKLASIMMDPGYRSGHEVLGDLIRVLGLETVLHSLCELATPCRVAVALPGFRRFVLWRHQDESGISGTGLVAVGVQLPSGACVMEWVGSYRSVVIHESVVNLQAVHCHGDKSEVVWIDGDRWANLRQ